MCVLIVCTVKLNDRSSVKMRKTLQPTFLCVRDETSANFDGFGNGQPCALGIDEAGRGPVLGPMVYGCAVSLISKQDDLKTLGFFFSSFHLN